MAVQKKMAFFVPAAGDAALGGEFDCWHPDTRFEQEEQRGDGIWKGTDVPAIPAEVGMPMVDLPKLLTHMIKHAWQAATPTPAPGHAQVAGAGRVRLATARQLFNPADIIRNAQARNQTAALTAPGRPNVGPSQGLKIAQDWKLHEALPRVCAYTFRGEKRTPAQIRADGGFKPPITRTDPAYVNDQIFRMFSSFVAHKHGIDLTKEAFDRAYAGIATNLEESKVLRDYLLWRTLVENEQFHLGRMKASEWMKGYISTTRAVTTAKHFAGRWGWVFVTLVRGGFVVPENGKHAWSGYNEQEIAFPGALPWAECIGFRQMDSSAADNRRGKFCGPVYLRKGFEARNAKAFTQVFDLLCGKKQ